MGVLDEDNRVVSVLEIAKLLGDKGHMHPHDAIFLPNGDIVVCCWWVRRVVGIGPAGFVFARGPRGSLPAFACAPSSAE